MSYSDALCVQGGGMKKCVCVYVSAITFDEGVVDDSGGGMVGWLVG